MQRRLSWEGSRGRGEGGEAPGVLKGGGAQFPLDYETGIPESPWNLKWGSRERLWGSEEKKVDPPAGEPSEV